MPDTDQGSALIFLHQANPYAKRELRLIALGPGSSQSPITYHQSQIANRAYSLFLAPRSLLSAPPQTAGPHNADQVLLGVYDATNGALKANATLAGGQANPTPHNADQVFLAVYDSVNGAVRINCVVGCSGNVAKITILGSSATDEASLGSELTGPSGWTTSGWTGSYAAGFTNGSGNTSPLSYTISGMATGQYYLVAATISGSTAGSLTLTLGGTTVNPGGIWNAPFWSGNGTWSAGVLTSGSGAFTITPTSTFNGTVGSFSVKLVTPISTFNLITQDSTGATSVAISQQLQSLQSLFVSAGQGYAGNYNLGQQNIGIGPYALQNNVTGYNNTALGSGALRYNISGGQNTAFGQNALANNTSGYYNEAFGQSALMNNTTGYANLALGEGALQDLTTGYFNTSVGDDSSFAETTGNYNTAVGRRAMYGATGSYLVAVGHQALNSNSGTNNVGVGVSALLSCTSGGYNTAVGGSAMGGASCTTAADDVALGDGALLAVTTGSYDAALGMGALAGLTTGQNDVAEGYNAAYNDTTGSDNVADGSFSLYTNSTGYYNTAVGYAALYYDTSGSSSAVGYQALYNLTGTGGVGVGYQAGKTETTGTYDTYLGYQADSNAAGLSNATAIGNGAKVATSNTMVLGNASVTDVYFGSTSGAANLHGVLPSTAVLNNQANSYSTGKQTFAASSSSAASINTPSGTAPSAPAAGDHWFDGDRVYVQDGETNSGVLASVPRRFAITSAVTATSTTAVTVGTFAVAASKTYCLSCKLFIQSSSTSNKPTMLVTCPSSPAASEFSFDYEGSTTAFTEALASCGSTMQPAATTTASTTLMSMLDGMLQNGTTAGSLTIQVESSGSYNTIIEPGSFCVLY